MSRSATCTYQIFTNNHILFHLWWKENLFNHQKVSKYFEHDCSCTMLAFSYLNLLCSRFFWVTNFNDRRVWTAKLLHGIRNSHQKCSIKIAVLKSFQKFKWNICARVSFLINLQAWGSGTLAKRDSGTGVFLWISLWTPFL